MGDIGTKIDKFIEIFINNRGYVKVLEGLKNTLIIAVIGLVIGVVIGTLIAMVRVIPKYKRLPRVLDAICRFYVGLFRGTPMVVQLLVFYYVLLPLMDAHMTGVQVSIMVFGLNSGAYISEIMRRGLLSVDPGQMEGGRAMGLSFATTMRKIVIPQAVKNIVDQGNFRSQLCWCFRSVCGIQLHRKQQLRVHDSISGYGNHLHRACPADQLWN